MSTGHHGGDAKRHLDEMIRRFVRQGEGTAAREYPEGRMGGADDGSLAFVVGTDERLGMSPRDAVRLASLLLKHARSIAKAPLTFEG